MNDGDALLAAILANPDDDTARLVYADWLQEHGDEDRAAFIRLQIERERLTPNVARFGSLAREERLLFARQKAEWQLPVRALMPSAVVQFRRGFIEEVTVQAAHFARNGAEALRLEPVRSVRVTQLGNYVCDVSRVERGPHTRVFGVVREAIRFYPEARVDFLRQAPDALEPELARNRWLVMAWAVWSGPDRRAVQEAIAFAGRMRPLQSEACRVAIRPFDRAEEFAPWCKVEVPETGPHWLLLENGRLVEDRIGLQPPERWRDYLLSVPAE